ncbi:hypothetical protein [Xanthomonas vasicola]|uniref:hypothetical protein n=1 Tax=Xanthomonas vasicola TaxID=56459 RepID=UPI00131F0861|nr:hypothetical protein [Xanthomonas vasicola]MBV6744240.1 hypothetical protein [Xanthomonas vasicola pv. musacearum NCPPB 2251]MBV7291801.1 hypothetical protein [Xanthomonas vasicola pv. musacearum]
MEGLKEVRGSYLAMAWRMRDVMRWTLRRLTQNALPTDAYPRHAEALRTKAQQGE